MARDLFQRGVEAAGQERWAQAERLLSRSLEIRPVANTYFNLAFVEENLGRVVSASEHYRRFLRMTRGDESRAEIRAQAQTSLDGLLERFSFITPQFSGWIEGDQLEIDGRLWSSEVLGESVPLDPGARVITVTRDDEIIARIEIELVEGQTETIAADLPPPVARTTASRPWYRSPWLWTAIGIGAAGGITATVLLSQQADPQPFDSTITAVEL